MTRRPRSSGIDTIVGSPPYTARPPSKVPRRRPHRPEQVAVAEARERVELLRALIPSLGRSAARQAMNDLGALISHIETVRAQMDPIKDPGASFDPGNPDTAGRLVALALVAQDRVPLARVARTYGSGVYSIYYAGPHPAYSLVSGTETPVYVGKADPARANARTAREQGPQLFGRLKDHRRMIDTVGSYARQNGLANPLDIADFTCRRLVCATNAQLVAERHLISLFKPIWNNEIGLCWGISKHGDAATTRGNKRSPWDVLHPGRSWAMAASLQDSASENAIVDRVRAHLEAHPPYRDREVIVETILFAFSQNAAATPDQRPEDDDTVPDIPDDSPAPDESSY